MCTEKQANNTNCWNYTVVNKRNYKNITYIIQYKMQYMSSSAWSQHTSISDVDLFWLYVDRRIAPGQRQIAEEQENPKFRFHHLVWLCWTETKTSSSNFYFHHQSNYRRRVHSKGWKHVDLSQEGWKFAVWGLLLHNSTSVMLIK